MWRVREYAWVRMRHEGVCARAQGCDARAAQDSARMEVGRGRLGRTRQRRRHRCHRSVVVDYSKSGSRRKVALSNDQTSRESTILNYYLIASSLRIRKLLAFCWRSACICALESSRRL